MSNLLQTNLIPFKADVMQPAPVNYNKRYTPPMPQNADRDDMLILQSELKKAQKREKSRDNWNKASVVFSGGIMLALLLSAVGHVASGKLIGEGLAKSAKGDGKKLADTLRAVDVSKERSFEDLTLSKEMQKVVDDMKTRLERAEFLKKKGSTGGSGIMLYGEPGGGKNAYVYAYTKYLQEKFPGSELYEMNVLKLQDKYIGETENNIMGFVEEFEKKAKANPNKKYIVFMDEFDSIARKPSDGNNNAEVRESFQNAFKTTLTRLTALDNIQVIAATNKAEKDEALNKMLDEAILNRFPQKIFVPLPTKDQLKKAIVEHYKSLPSEMVNKELTDINNSKLDKICRDISKETNHASFRDLQYIFEHARLISESKGRKEGSPITIKDLREAVKKHADGENWTEKAKKKNDEEKTRTISDLNFVERLLVLFHGGK